MFTNTKRERIWILWRHRKFTERAANISDKREAEWSNTQNGLHTARIENLIIQGKHRSTYIDKVLKKWKTWGGPFTCGKELETALSESDEKCHRNILRHELIFQKHTHPVDAIARKELYNLLKH